MTNHVGDRVGAAQNAVAVAQQKLRFFLWMALFLLDDEERRFMCVAEDREQGGAIQMIQRVITPFAGRDARAVRGQYLTELGSREIKLTSKFFWNGHA